MRDYYGFSEDRVIIFRKEFLQKVVKECTTEINHRPEKNIGVFFFFCFYE